MARGPGKAPSKNDQIRIRLTTDDKAVIVAAAGGLGKVAKWCRVTLLDVARNALPTTPHVGT